MNTIRSIAFVALLGSLSTLPACRADQVPDTGAKHEEKSAIGKAVSEGMAEARQEIRQGNFTISEDEKNLPKAEITPQGDLLIDGRAVAINPEQRTLLLEYRTHLTAIAESGMEIGVQSADLATKAMGEAFKGVFSGKSEQDIERSVEAEAAKIKTSAAKLCGHLPKLMAVQQKLAAALPEFQPYATMTEEDIDDCFKDTDADMASDQEAEDPAAAAAAATVAGKETSN